MPDTSPKRKEDARLLTGAGRYVDDIRIEGMLECAVIRSADPHGRLIGLDTAAALQHPGVVAIIGPDDVSELPPIPCVRIPQGQVATSYPLIPSTVRYVGEAVGLVVAETRATAEDGVDLVGIQLEPLEPIVSTVEAMTDVALLHPEWGSNIAVDNTYGDSATAVRELIAGAEVVVTRTFQIGRQTGNPIEPRGIVADYDPLRQTMTVWTSTQVAHHVRDHIAFVLGLSPTRVRVVSADVGGGFGVKEHIYPDELLACQASKQLGRPVKWIQDRRESFLTDNHARALTVEASLATDRSGRFVALDCDIVCDLGAFPTNVGSAPAAVAATMLQGPYVIPLAASRMRAVVTNKTPLGAYRGFGMQEAAWVRERLVDDAARELSMDPAEIRIENMIPQSAMPFTTRYGITYDSGDYAGSVRQILELVREWPDPPHDGRRRGIGLASYVESTGLGPAAMMQRLDFRLNGHETGVVEIELDGSISVSSGVCPMGQGIETTLAQLAAEALNADLDRVNVVLADTASTPYSSAGSIASRSITVAGGAVVQAAQALRDKVMRIAAYQLGSGLDDVVLTDGEVRLASEPSKGVDFPSLARDASLGWNLPEGEAPGLKESALYSPTGSAYGYATHAVAIAVDDATGRIELERYAVAHDCGRPVNEMIVEGQIHGGVAQGIAGALLEDLVYDSRAQLLTTSYMDYLLPTSAEVPDIDLAHTQIDSPITPGGMKGVGEAGTIAPAAAIGNALAQAYPEIAELVTQTPMSPDRVWNWIRGEHG